MKERLLWIDIETTGLDPKRNRPLEIAFALTDPKLKIIESDSHLIQWSAEARDEIKRTTSDYIREMHEKSGLWKDAVTGNAGCVPIMDVEGCLVRMIMTAEKDADCWFPCKLAGSKPSFDREWLVSWFPHLARIPHYRDFDMNTVRSLLRLPKGWGRTEGEERPHRAHDDLMEDIGGLRAVMKILDENDVCGLFGGKKCTG